MSERPNINGPGLDADTHLRLDGRVSRVEVELSGVRESIERVETEAREGQQRLERKLDDQTSLLASKLDRLANVQASAGKPNWSALIGAGSLTVVIIGAIGAAWLNPLAVRDGEHARRMDAIEHRASEDREVLMRVFEQSIRADERTKGGGK